MANEKKIITAYDSSVIEKQLKEVKTIIDKYDNFFYTDDPNQTVMDTIIECRDVLDFIEQYIEV